MERRREPRIDLSQPVQVTLLGNPEVELPAIIINISGRGLKLMVDRLVPIGSAAKVEVDDALLLGEVCYSAAEEDGYAVGLEIAHSLVGLGDLQRLNRRLMGDLGAGGTPSIKNQDTTATRYQERSLRETDPAGR